MRERPSGMDEGAAMSLPIFLALEIREIPFIWGWLDMRVISLLDMAVSCRSARETWLVILKIVPCTIMDTWHHSHLSIK
jgi:hypothetical protein